jgi:hypothetical protein
MVVWHNTPDALRIPDVVRAGDHVSLWIGTWPIEPGQSVLVDLKILKATGEEILEQRQAEWHSNHEPRNNSYWVAHLGSFEAGDTIQYTISGTVGDQKVADPNVYSFEVT